MKLGGSFLKSGRTTPEQFEAVLQAMADRKMNVQVVVTGTSTTRCWIRRHREAKRGVTVLHYESDTEGANTILMWKTPLLSFRTGEAELLAKELQQLFQMQGWEAADLKFGEEEPGNTN